MVAVKRDGVNLRECDFVREEGCADLREDLAKLGEGCVGRSWRGSGNSFSGKYSSKVLEKVVSANLIYSTCRKLCHPE